MSKKPPTKVRAVPSASDALSAPAARVLRRFRMVFNAVKSHFRQVEASAGVAGAHVWALSVISEQPGIGVGGVADAMDIHQSTASNLLKPLIERGMVAADREGEDRRAVHLHISAKGAAVLRDAPGPFAGILPGALSSMDAATLSRLDRDLAVLCAALGVQGRGPILPLGQPPGRGAVRSNSAPKMPAAKAGAMRGKPAKAAPASKKRPASKRASRSPRLQRS